MTPRKKPTRFKHISPQAVEALLGNLVIAFRPEFALLGLGTPRGPLGSNGALMLSQGVYLQKVEADDEGWWSRTQQEWLILTGLSEDEQKSARDEIVLRGYWDEDYFGQKMIGPNGREARGPGRLHTRIDSDVLCTALNDLVSTLPGWYDSQTLSAEQQEEKRRARNAKLRDKRRLDREVKKQLQQNAHASENAGSTSVNDIASLFEETAQPERHASENLGSTSYQENRPVEAALCFPETPKHVSEKGQDMQPEKAAAPSIIESLTTTTGLYTEQQHESLQLSASSESPLAVVFGFQPDVVAVEVSDAENIVLKDLELAGFSRTTARELVDRHGVDIIDVALADPAQLQKLVSLLPVEAPTPAPQPAPQRPTAKPAPSLPTPAPGMSEIDRAAILIGQLRAIDVQPPELAGQWVERYGVDYVAYYYAKALTKSNPAGYLRKALVEDYDKLRENGIPRTTIAAQPIWAKPYVADPVDRDSEAQRQVENDRLDDAFDSLSELTKIKIETAVRIELAARHDTSEFGRLLLQRQLVRHALGGQLEDGVAEMRAQREANG